MIGSKKGTRKRSHFVGVSMAAQYRPPLGQSQPTTELEPMLNALHTYACDNVLLLAVGRHLLL